MTQQLVFDIGMHVGRDTEFYLKKGFRVVSVEANPALAAAAVERFRSELQSGQLVIVNKALVDDDSKTIEFYLNEKKDDWGTVLPTWNRSLSEQFRRITVPAIRLEDLVSEYGLPYYLKIDIEGADVYCLRSLIRMGRVPEYTSVELMTPNNMADQKADCLEILACLRAVGYTKFQISDQSQLKSVRCPNPPSEGAYVDFKFDGYSSGLFGKELQTPTYSIDQLAELYLAYFYGRQRRSLLSLFAGQSSESPFHAKGWFDIHARKS